MNRNVLVDRYLRCLPTVFCPGCGCGTVLNVLAHALSELDIEMENVVAVSGIGCSSWISSPYLKCDILHVTHGRPIAFATGVKIMKPDMKVIVIAGDGDLVGIGGNHLIHAARRNIDITVFMVNNMIYGMTGGQVAPTTPKGTVTKSTPYGNIEHPFDVVELVTAAGASYVSRWTTYHVFQLKKAMIESIQRNGFSFVEILSQCPEEYGRRIGKSHIDILKMFKELSNKRSHIKLGKFVDRTDVPEFVGELRKIRERCEDRDR